MIGKEPVPLVVGDYLLYFRPWALGDADAVSDVLYRELYPHEWLEGSREVVDVGAHVGAFTVLAAAHGASEILAIEPHPDNAELLRRNVEENDLNVEVVEAAAYDREDVVKMYLSPSTVAYSVELVRSRETIDVETVVIDDLGVSPDLIKIDAEGAEEHVLRGSERTLEEYAPVLLISAYHYPGQEEDVRRWLEDRNYRVEVIVRETSPYRSPALRVPVIVGEPRA
ncbi:FkbM family methyltransferase [Methanopyrus sp. KOL6]|uniref:FkbM family methyltransferase n=1 Tax=Methanopyrus sp. KOL6 TaxID=1937004 RepID=UPI0012F894D3|nr:FkbM family methyltransferase [Methanopyrus sp. KOL6]